VESLKKVVFRGADPLRGPDVNTPD